MINQYIFVYRDRDGSYPERYRVIAHENDTDIPDLDELTGTVKKADVETLKAQLAEKYPAPEYLIASSGANIWSAVQKTYGSLDYDYDGLV